MTNVLTIAGTDPSGGAGIQVDGQVFRDFGFHGLSAITAIVWQNTVGVRGFKSVGSGQLGDQLAAVSDDLEFAAVKIGMLPDVEAVEVVSEFLEASSSGGGTPVVYDPVLAAGSGDRELHRGDVVGALRSELLPRIDVLTPNLPEGANLSGLEAESLAGMCRMAEALFKRGPSAVLLKGGHLQSRRPRGVIDVWADQAGAELLRALDRVVDDVRGTGCQLSSAVAALLATGRASRRRAAGQARIYLNRLLHESTERIGQGRPVVVRDDSRSREIAQSILRDLDD
jgi:hydroxymethylpyrimidine/phosphomethylpyrimidine kinase